MLSTALRWPAKTREFHNHHFDSTVWNGFRFRDDDIVIATYAKTGTTWTQQIIAQLSFADADELPVADMSPWLDLRVPPNEVKLAALAAQTHRRFIKTHLPLDALVYSPRAKYIYIARDGRDVVWSMYNHHVNANALWYRLLNDTPGRVGPPIEQPPASVRQYFLDWMDRDGHPFWPFWEHIAGWWAARDLPNLMLLHFEELRSDLPGQMRRIAAFLDIPVDEARFPIMVEHCSFAWMKANATKSTPLGGAIWDGGAAVFINQGTNGRWRDVLTPQDVARYERTARERLGEDCAAARDRAAEHIGHHIRSLPRNDRRRMTPITCLATVRDRRGNTVLPRKLLLPHNGSMKNAYRWIKTRASSGSIQFSGAYL